MYLKTRFLTAIMCISLSTGSLAQTRQQPDIYIDYTQLLTTTLRKADTLLRTGARQASGADLRTMAASLTDDSPPTETIRLAASGTDLIPQEEMYNRRKHNVLLICRLRRLSAKPADLSVDFLGTAFPISDNGICVTNYHIFRNVFPGQQNADSTDGIYCVLTLDGGIYFVDRTLAYSQNNDLAIFHVATNGVKIAPVPLGTRALVGADVYCLSHPQGFFYYFSKGIVASNIVIDGQQSAVGYNPQGRPPIRMNITADYGIGSSGAPILDKYGNLAGIVSTTLPIGTEVKAENGMVFAQQQMVVKQAIPVTALQDLLSR